VSDASAAARRLIEHLREPGRYAHPVGRVELVETHISWVLLAGDYAYKVKKPVDLGFLDFTSLAARHRFCQEELRLNRRTAAALYLDVVPIGGSVEEPVIGAAPAIEYAVRMRRFEQDALLDRLARRGALGPDVVDALADATALFHAEAARATAASGFGSAGRVRAAALQNFDQLAAFEHPGETRAELAALRDWTERELAARRDAIEARRLGGFVRECHGDLHLGNVALVDGRPVPFDCIEFNDDFRWIDVMSEVAFLVMDLFDHRLDALAWRCLNRYLEATGDYEGLAVLRFHLVYRAMVRAKIARIRAAQDELAPDARSASTARFREYLALARRLATGARPAIVLMHGLSGSGKTTVAGRLVEALGAVRVRSDVERKRLLGLKALERTHAEVASGAYDAETTRRTYHRLAAAARAIAGGGFRAIADAAFLHAADRAAFGALARELAVPLAIAACTAPEAALRARIAARERAATDASEASLAVLDHQLATYEPLDAGERAAAVTFDTGTDQSAAIHELARRLAPAEPAP
jgi:aminoglycoside phosphotransferase family enzyme/predicted kinase